MSLIKCKECETVISSSAKSCPKCGANTPKKTSTFTMIVAIFFAFVFFQIVAVNCDGGAKKNSAPPEKTQAEIDESTQSDAKWACRKFVEKSLKAPSTADFQNYNNFAATGTGNGPFEVLGYVDAQNSFGAKIRTEFMCKLIKTEKGWRLVDLSLI